MAIIVQKFGGTSSLDISHIKTVAKLVMNEKIRGSQVVVVVSAMETFTNSFVDLAKITSSLDDNEKLSEYDSILSTGEQISSALLALVLQSHQVKARSWLGWQIPIITNTIHSRAIIEEIKIDKIKANLDNNIIPVIADFQAVSKNCSITTISRGSETIAVAIALALKAERCDVYIDTNGMFTSNPRIINTASKPN